MCPSRWVWAGLPQGRDRSVGRAQYCQKILNFQVKQKTEILRKCEILLSLKMLAINPNFNTRQNTTDRPLAEGGRGHRPGRTRTLGQGCSFSSAGRIFILPCGHTAALQTFPVFVVFTSL